MIGHCHDIDVLDGLIETTIDSDDGLTGGTRTLLAETHDSVRTGHLRWERAHEGMR